MNNGGKDKCNALVIMGIVTGALITNALWLLPTAIARGGDPTVESAAMLLLGGVIGTMSFILGNLDE